MWRRFAEESWLVLMLGAAFAALLAGAQTTLSARIAVNQTAELNAAIRAVVPGTTEVERVAVAGYQRDVYRCRDDGGRLVGWAVDALGMGFADKIRLVVGLSPDTRVISGIKVIENVETPGLGNKIAQDDPASDQDYPDRYQGLDAARPVVVQKARADRGRNEVQAITGATISSRAVAQIVSQALELVRPELERIADVKPQTGTP